jgi:opacity protein-like surface antigen
MKTLLIFSLLLFAAAGTASAQDAQATPNPDPHVFSDPAMTFTAPPEAVLVGRQDVTSPDKLSQDLAVVAAWVLDPGKENARTIQLAMESYDGKPSQWEGQFESQTHGSQDGILIRDKTPMTLLNGMPATFVEIAFGSGFDAQKEYAIVWADGLRGIVLSETSRLGFVTADQARQTLKQVTAVAYPLYEP